MIPFNRPCVVGTELLYIQEAITTGKLSGDGMFTKLCHQFFHKEWGCAKPLLTTSCTDALELAALLLDIQPGDEVIIPSFTFPSTANAFVLRGARILFADSSPHHPNLDLSQLSSLITPRTRAIVPVHYAGVACDMDPLLALAKEHNLFVVEDAAQGVASFYKGRRLGTIGHLGAFSFHETKNLSSGEGGMLAINDLQFSSRAEVLREKGTNRSQFFRGEVAKYNWVDIGSSFLPSELTAAFLYAQLEKVSCIQAKRLELWNAYYEGLQPWAAAGYFELPWIPSYATNNAHLFYLICTSEEERDALIAHLKAHQIMALFHYQPLHSSPYYREKHGNRELPYAERYSRSLLRLPLFYDLSLEEVAHIIQTISEFYPPWQRQATSRQRRWATLSQDRALSPLFARARY